MKKTVLKVLLFFSVNALGFYISPLMVIFVSATDLVDMSNPDFNAVLFQHDVFFKHYMTWMVCALFSFSFFFLKGMWRYIMLGAPVAIPLIYTTMNMMKYL